MYVPAQDVGVLGQLVVVPGQRDEFALARLQHLRHLRQLLPGARTRSRGQFEYIIYMPVSIDDGHDSEVLIIKNLNCN